MCVAIIPSEPNVVHPKCLDEFWEMSVCILGRKNCQIMTKTWRYRHMRAFWKLGWSIFNTKKSMDLKYKKELTNTLHFDTSSEIHSRTGADIVIFHSFRLLTVVCRKVAKLSDFHTTFSAIEQINYYIQLSDKIGTNIESLCSRVLPKLRLFVLLGIHKSSKIKQISEPAGILNKLWPRIAKYYTHRCGARIENGGWGRRSENLIKKIYL